MPKDRAGKFLTTRENHLVLRPSGARHFVASPRIHGVQHRRKNSRDTVGSWNGCSRLLAFKEAKSGMQLYMFPHRGKPKKTNNTAALALVKIWEKVVN